MPKSTFSWAFSNYLEDKTMSNATSTQKTAVPAELKAALLEVSRLCSEHSCTFAGAIGKYGPVVEGADFATVINTPALPEYGVTSDHALMDLEREIKLCWSAEAHEPPRDKVRDRVELLIYSSNNEFLVEELLSDAWPDNKGKFRCPGGKIEEGETDIEALTREMREEYDWDLEPGQVQATPLSDMDEERGRVVRYRLTHSKGIPKPGATSAEGCERLVLQKTVPAPWV
jgi:ADP-ribose pyrophosphatase YjhB (NUDIX family)